MEHKLPDLLYAKDATRVPQVSVQNVTFAHFIHVLSELFVLFVKSNIPPIIAGKEHQITCLAC